MPDLFPFQKDGVEFLINRKYALLADEQGLGKTAQAIYGAKTIDADHALVICPASVKYNWQKEIELWDPAASIHILKNTKVPDDIKATYLIVNYDLIHRPAVAKYLLTRGYDLIICDEAHYIKNSRSKRSKMVLAKSGLADKAGRVWLLTGTPVLNRPVELFPMLRRFMPDRLGKFKDYMTFTKRYCAGYQGKFGWDVRGASNIQELAGYLDGFMLRRLKKDVMKDLPDKTFQKIVFDAPSKTCEKRLKEEREAFNSQYGETAKDGLLGAIATIRREIGEAKVPMAIEHIKNLLEEKDKLVIFAYHRSVIAALQKELSEYHPVVLAGGLSAEQKQKAVDDFVTRNSKRVFIGQIEAAGVGIDGLQRVADTVVFVELSWVPGQIKQAIDRCHRIGQANKVLVQFLAMKGGIDEDIFASIESKTKVIKRLVDVPDKNIIFDMGLSVEKRESIKIKEAEMSIESSLERIAVALENIAMAKPSAPAVEIDPTTDGPVDPKPQPKAKAKPIVPKAAPVDNGFATTKDFLAYCNKKLLAIADKAVAKQKIADIMVAIKAQFGAATIAALNVKDVAAAKEIVDEILG